MQGLEKLNEAIAHGRGEFDLDDVIKMAENGAMQIWKLPDSESICVTEFVQYPKKKRLRVVLMTGAFDEKVVTFFEGLAKSMNCAGVEVIGRKGWIKALKPWGYEEASVNVVKDFEGNEDE